MPQSGGPRSKAGHEVTVYNRTPSKAQGLIDRGAHLAAQVADACQGDAVITMLADDGAVEGVVLGEGGVLQSLGKRTIHVSMRRSASPCPKGSPPRTRAPGNASSPRLSSAGRMWRLRAGYSSSPRARPTSSKRARLSSRRWDRRPSTSAICPKRQIS